MPLATHRAPHAAGSMVALSTTVLTTYSYHAYECRTPLTNPCETLQLVIYVFLHGYRTMAKL